MGLAHFAFIPYVLHIYISYNYHVQLNQSRIKHTWRWPGNVWFLYKVLACPFLFNISTFTFGNFLSWCKFLL
ncbi:hypothetical protein BdWA1_000319 [Babesia duncani]|uniref:Uncharacterized protein n=1 Tax=Babesia duncani TaxID=323732 RepID=A0AAD9UPZ5_9APIC|nr:hypothetical protein BdWA1_000319 [Babesia duncani]